MGGTVGQQPVFPSVKVKKDKLSGTVQWTVAFGIRLQKTNKLNKASKTAFYI